MSPDKLRINSDEGGGFKSVEDELNSTHPVFVCKLCGKEFGSGKALGGHMRVHAPQQWPVVLKNKLNGVNRSRSAGKIKSSSYLDDLVKDGNPTCSLCKKTFHSRKSLFGHMRCHPEREWRGMRPPPALNSAPISGKPSSTVSYSSHDSVSSTIPVDLLQPLSGWSMKKSRRGRNVTIEAVDDDDDDKLLSNSAVHGLMLLAATEDRISEDEDHHSSYDDNSAIGKKKRKTVKLKDLDYPVMSSPAGPPPPPPPPPIAAKCYKCVTCDKAFPSPQALGGHRSSAHNNKKTSVIKEGSSKTNSIHDLDHDDNQQAIIVMHPPPAEALTTLAVVSHICNICDNAFPSGQALGGHKRCHWKPPTATTGGESSAALEHPPSWSSSSSDPGQSAQTTNKPLLDFDLNELPPEYHFFSF